MPGSLFAPIASGKPADIAISPNGRTLYAAGTDGNVRVFDVATRALKATWDAGTMLGGMDVSADGSFLLVAERKATGRVLVHRLETRTGVVEAEYSTRTDGGRTAYDVGIMADGTALVTEDDYSNHLPLWRLDLATATFAASQETYAVRSTLEVSRDRTQASLSANLSSAPLYVYETGTGVTHSHANYQDGVMGTSYGVHAISLEGNRIAQFASSLYVYDAELDFIRDVGRSNGNLGSHIVGLAFDAQGSNLFALNQIQNKIYQLSTSSWQVVRDFDVGTPVSDANGLRAGDFGNRLSITPDGAHFIIVTTTGLQLVANDDFANSFKGTEGADNFNAGLGNDDITGEKGNDVLDGGPGADRMRGGTGHDHYIIDDAGDLVLELRGSGTDAVQSRISYTLPAHVENLTLTGRAAINGTGNDLANALTGNDGANWLNGAAGADTLTGAKGSDTYIVDNPGDRLIELARSGTDSVVSSVGFWLPNHVENLTLAGTGKIEGHGNWLANRMIGNSGSNVLSGSGGNDVIGGGAGDDRLYGADGNDTLTGGAGRDRFFFNVSGGPANADRILDFSAADDTIHLARYAFSGFSYTGALRANSFRAGGAAGDATDRIIYHKASGSIFHDADGTGAAEQVLIATVTPGTPITVGDFIIYA